MLSFDPIEAAVVAVGFDRGDRPGLAADAAVETVAEHLGRVIADLASREPAG